MGKSYDAWYNEQAKKQREEQDLADEEAYVQQELQDIADDDERIAHEKEQLDQ